MILSLLSLLSLNAGEAIRALITLYTLDSGDYRSKIASESSIKQYLRALKQHEKSVTVSLHGCNMVYSLATTDALRLRLGTYVQSALSLCVCPFAPPVYLLSLVALTIIDWTPSTTGNLRACETVSNVLSKHCTDNALVASWAFKAIVSLSQLEDNKLKFQTQGMVTSAVTVHVGVLFPLLCGCDGAQVRGVRVWVRANVI